MKKLLLILIGLFILTGCNYDIIDTHYDYDKIICNYNGDKFELSIDSWHDYDGEQIQVRSNGKVYLLTANNCYLIEE